MFTLTTLCCTQSTNTFTLTPISQLSFTLRLHSADLQTGPEPINVSLVYMAWDVRILMRADLLQEPIEGVGPENQDFFGP
jgi:hypothetical protein